MRIIPVSASKSYDVMIGKQLLSQAGKLTHKLNDQKYQRIGVVTDSNVDKLYRKQVVDSYQSAGYEVVHYVFPAGESSKSMQQATGIISWLIENSFTRSDLLVALGGGVCGDLVGFVASIYLRGIDFVQIPTTLLAAIDSSVGGKTAVNIPEGKNLVGCFWQPRLVVCDITTLATLADADFKSGIAEAIKYGCIWDKALFNQLSTPDWQQNALEDVIARCVEIKAEVVSQDEKEMGIRAFLNFGHTIGHAIEKLSKLRVPHGYGVAIGMYMISLAGENARLVDNGVAEKIKNILEVYGLPYSTNYSYTDIADACLGDKKRTGNSIKLIIVKTIGECEIVPFATDKLPEFIKGGLL